MEETTKNKKIIKKEEETMTKCYVDSDWGGANDWGYYDW